MDIMTAIRDEAASTDLVETENGALGYAGAKSAVEDFFFKASTMRQWRAERKQAAFLAALAEDRELAFRLLFFVRDARKGLGERKLFRDVLEVLPEDVVVRLLPLVPEFGRWDDVWALLGDGGAKGAACLRIRDAVYALVRRQWEADLRACREGGAPSLLGKWLPSAGKVSGKQVALAKRLARECLGIRIPDYRRGLSLLRRHLRVVECRMCLGEWGAIDYGEVPSKAAKNYRNAFLRHDEERYRRYLDGLSRGESRVNAGAVYPYEIVAAYCENRYGAVRPSDDALLEAQWKALPLPGGLLENAIVVRDGSGSMAAPVSNGRSCALDVATSLAVLMSEHLKGPFANRFITFSERPRFVDLSGCETLRQKLVRVYAENECANTDIERTMRLVLDAAVKNGLRQEDIPAVVIVSDMEFDEARGENRSERTLFETIRREWKDAGYDLPKMVFWNVASRTGAVPMQENANGLLLVGGFSQNVLDILSGEGTMLDLLREKLMDERYDPVWAAVSAEA